ncbi:MAG: hypothetical protein GXY34_08240 [Syntrophomonadaceae bacterium]|nr:hypothetical protein [Syntrophomonadaceae bacterium]
MLKRSRFRAYIVCVLALTMLLLPVSFAMGQETGSGIQDDELVVTTLDNQSGIASIQVLDNLRIPAGSPAEVKDGMGYNLSSVRNLYSSEAVVKKTGYVGIQAGGKTAKDLYYLAALDKKEYAKVKYPVSVKVEYYLDGEKMPADKLAGKSGHLKIVCNLENLTGEKRVLEFKNSQGQLVQKETEIYTPYVVSLSGWEFNNKIFTNIKAPGVAEVSPEGVTVNVQGVTQVNWTVPLIPPKYPAKQYTVLEADATKIDLPSCKIVVIPICPTTSEIDNLGTFEESFNKLYDGFDQIQKGVGERSQNATLLFGLAKIKDGMGTLSSGMGTLVEKMKMIRDGLSNSAFDASSYNAATGADASGKTPGLKDAVGLLKAGVQDRALPAYEMQKMILGLLDTSVGHAGEAVVEPSDTTSLYNDVAYLKAQVSGPQKQIITANIEPKLSRLSSNIKAYRDGGTIATGSGTMPFPASVKALEEGSKETLAALDKIDSGLGVMVVGVGSVGANGQPMKVMVNGSPGTIMYALSYMKESIDGQVVPGLDQLADGASKIGTGAGGAKDALTTGLVSLQAAGPTATALGENAAKADTFLGKPEGATGRVVYVFQTPAVDQQAGAMKVGAGLIALALILLVAIGRAPKEMFQAPAENQA